MPRTLTDWYQIISSRPQGEHRFAGTPANRPKAGDRVRIISGLHVGEEFDVVSVRGPLYAPDQRIYVDVPDGIPTWYNVWDVQVLGSGG